MSFNSSLVFDILKLTKEKAEYIPIANKKKMKNHILWHECATIKQHATTTIKYTSSITSSCVFLAAYCQKYLFLLFFLSFLFFHSFFRFLSTIKNNDHFFPLSFLYCSYLYSMVVIQIISSEICSCVVTWISKTTWL